MEERLAQFIESASSLDFDDLESAGVLRFVRSHVVKLAVDCLQRSKDKLISSAYFYELSENLQTLLSNVSKVCVFVMMHVIECRLAAENYDFTMIDCLWGCRQPLRK